MASDVRNAAVLVRRLVSTFPLPVLAQTSSVSASTLNRLATATANNLAQGIVFVFFKNSRHIVGLLSELLLFFFYTPDFLVLFIVENHMFPLFFSSIKIIIF